MNVQLEAQQWVLKTFPFGYKTRRVLGSVGLTLFMLHLLGSGILLGAGLIGDPKAAGIWTWALVGSLVINFVVDILLVYQMPAKPCSFCGVRA